MSIGNKGFRLGVPLLLVGLCANPVRGGAVEGGTDPAVTTAANHVSELRANFSAAEQGPAMLFIGTTHTHDPSDAQLGEIKERLQSFRPDVVLIEGGEWVPLATPEETVSRLGELAYVKFLADKMAIRTMNADPEYGQELRHAVARFGAVRTKLFYALRMVPQFRSAQGGGSLAERMGRELRARDYQDIAELKDVVVTIPQLQRAVAAELPRLKSWDAIDSDLLDGTLQGSPLSDIAIASTSFRDRYTAELIEKQIMSGRRVLIVEGAAHLDNQRKALFSR